MKCRKCDCVAVRNEQYCEKCLTSMWNKKLDREFARDEKIEQGLSEEEVDKYLLIKGLCEIEKWSFRKIGRLIRQHQDTAKSLYDKALELSGQGKLDKFGKSEEKVEIFPVGDSRDCEYVDSVENHNVCGGGRKVDQSYSDED